MSNVATMAGENSVGKIAGVLSSGALGNGLGAVGLLFSVATFIYGEDKPDATQEAIKGLKEQLDREDKKLDQIKSLLKNVLNQEKKAQIEDGTYSARQRIIHLYDNVSKTLSKEDRGSDDNIKVMADGFIDPTFGYGDEIAKHMTGYLQEIHTVLTSDDDTNLFTLAAEHFFEMDNFTLPTSVCERLFRYVDYMRLVQVKGLLCLKFINYPNGVKVNDGKNYQQLYQDLVTRLTIQGEFFKNKIDNDYLKRNVRYPFPDDREKACPAFTWFGFKDGMGDNDPHIDFFAHPNYSETGERYLNGGIACDDWGKMGGTPTAAVTGVGFFQHGEDFQGIRAVAPNIKVGTPDASGKIISHDDNLRIPDAEGFFDFSSFIKHGQSDMSNIGGQYMDPNRTLSIFGGWMQLADGSVMTGFGFKYYIDGKDAKDMTLKDGNDHRFYPGIFYSWLQPDGSLTRMWNFDWKEAFGDSNRVIFISGQSDVKGFDGKIASNFIGGTDSVLTGVVIFPIYTNHWLVMALENRFNLKNFTFNVNNAIVNALVAGDVAEIKKLFDKDAPHS